MITDTTTRLQTARATAATVTDPEMPMLTLLDLGVLRGVDLDEAGRLIVTITPTYSGCPAMATMRDDLRRALTRAGFDDVDVRTTLSPAWSSDWISATGRRKLSDHGIATPAPAPTRSGGPIPLTLIPFQHAVRCPHCDSLDTEQTSAYGSTACKAMHRCRDCGEPFDRIKEI
ncbi:1,2-phenylacetyl-CoA epoxidase subunit PaaD [Mycolicibacterium sp. CH28]|uniref:1,2-phenylacetyl-CoA epoxidase subunit PaaD n=1 Tax=Mycolicibacterium sp. CH28 TaxID=2512237 RepID=UPI002102717F|nr:1,2-phenylacetyl-CoA epoxidase subunit PaaD [Mycolicibacterium sp. CH28]